MHKVLGNKKYGYSNLLVNCLQQYHRIAFFAHKNQLNLRKN